MKSVKSQYKASELEVNKSQRSDHPANIEISNNINQELQQQPPRETAPPIIKKKTMVPDIEEEDNQELENINNINNQIELDQLEQGFSNKNGKQTAGSHENTNIGIVEELEQYAFDYSNHLVHDEIK